MGSPEISERWLTKAVPGGGAVGGGGGGGGSLRFAGFFTGFLGGIVGAGGFGAGFFGAGFFGAGLAGAFLTAFLAGAFLTAFFTAFCAAFFTAFFTGFFAAFFAGIFFAIRFSSSVIPVRVTPSYNFPQRASIEIKTAGARCRGRGWRPAARGPYGDTPDR